MTSFASYFLPLLCPVTSRNLGRECAKCVTLILFVFHFIFDDILVNAVHLLEI